VLSLIADTIAECQRQGKGVSVCGEMAGDEAMTRLLLRLGLRSFSMHPSQILAVKHQVLRSDTSQLAPWAAQVLAAWVLYRTFLPLPNRVIRVSMLPMGMTLWLLPKCLNWFWTVGTPNGSKPLDHHRCHLVKNRRHMFNSLKSKNYGKNQ
jgi:hypothetical protein